MKFYPPRILTIPVAIDPPWWFALAAFGVSVCAGIRNMFDERVMLLAITHIVKRRLLLNWRQMCRKTFLVHMMRMIFNGNPTVRRQMGMDPMAMQLATTIVATMT